MWSGHACRLCGADLTCSFVDLGMSPLCESYIPAESVDAPEVFYPLNVLICEKCLLVQLPVYVSGEHIFSDYAYFSSYSDSWVAHAPAICGRPIDALGLDVGQPRRRGASNDGHLLQHVFSGGIRRSESSRRGTSLRSSRQGHRDDGRVLSRLRAGIASEDDKADLVAGHVVAHAPDLSDFVAGLRARVKASRPSRSSSRTFSGSLSGASRHDQPRHFSHPSTPTASRCWPPMAARGRRRGAQARMRFLRLYARPAETAGQPPERVQVVL